MLAQATLSGDAAGRSALASLCERYHAPIRRHLCQRGYAEAEAAEFTQEFFRVLLESRAWKRADRARGKFRTFLLATLMHIISAQRVREGAEKRGGGVSPLSIEEVGEAGLVDFDVAEKDALSFDREWALCMVESVIAALEQECSKGARSNDWNVVVRFLPGGGTTPSFEDAAAEAGVNLAAMKTFVHRLRQRFRELLRAAVARTVDGPGEVDAEIAHLRNVLTVHGP